MKVDEFAAVHGQMVQIRLPKEHISTPLYAVGAIPRFVHTSPGQEEACAVGVLVHARGSDAITSIRRGRGYVAATGLEPRQLLAEVIGKQAGACRGRGGSMHVAQSLEAFARTDRMVIAQVAVTDFGVGAEIAALAVSAGFWSLDTPALRVGAPYATVREREREREDGQTEIAAAVHEVMAC